MKKIHIALGVSDIEASERDYSQRLGCKPDLIISHEYALWRTETVNLSIRKVAPEQAGTLRHLGWEDLLSSTSSAERDVNGILWEHFTAEQQAEEIRQIWRTATYRPRSSL